ncbi:MAG: TFIIB-type zinc ribbon-containing protein [Methanobacteriaceae archaeon]|nr:TFIIB-type zinc ribbon-containing protein [Methanobacteriaceae archaeon]
MIESKENIYQVNRQLNSIKFEFEPQIQNRHKRDRQRENQIQVSNQLVCPECGSMDITKDPKSLEYLCVCGCVVDEDFIDQGKDWRNFKGDTKNRSHVGRPKSVTIHDGGLGTNFNWSEKVSEDNKFLMYRLERLQRRSRINSNKERNLATAFTRLNLITSNLSLPSNVRELSGTYYRKVLNLGLVHGRSIDDMISACVYISCQKLHISRTYDEIAEVLGVKTKVLARNSKLIKSKLNIKYTPTSPSEYVPRYISNLGLSSEVERKSLDILYQIKDKNISGKPSALAASAIYLACSILSEKVTQEKIAESTNISPVTIRKRYKIINDAINC